jgi:hypothetical protein
MQRGFGRKKLKGTKEGGEASWSAPGSFERHGALGRDDSKGDFDLLTSIATAGFKCHGALRRAPTRSPLRTNAGGDNAHTEDTESTERGPIRTGIGSGFFGFFRSFRRSLRAAVDAGGEFAERNEKKTKEGDEASWSAPGSFERHGALGRDDSKGDFDLLTSIATPGFERHGALKRVPFGSPLRRNSGGDNAHTEDTENTERGAEPNRHRVRLFRLFSFFSAISQGCG